jgi:hypothetical protein
MKLSEMNTDQLAKCLCALTAPAAEIMGDENVLKALADMGKRDGRTMLGLIADTARALVPLFLETHYGATVSILAAMTGKTAGAIRKQNGLQTIKEARACIDQDLIDFFKSSAPTEKQE